jgi:hypothetical protein
MKVYSSDGFRLGKVREVRPPKTEEAQPASPFRPLRNPEPVYGDVVDLDITGTVEPVGAEQPTQEEVGVDPEDDPHGDERIGRVIGKDVGEDYKVLGESADTRAPGELADPRVSDGYFRVVTGLDSADLYVPLSAVAYVAREGRLVLSPTREELNASGWAAKPAGYGAESRDGGLLSRLLPWRRG